MSDKRGLLAKLTAYFVMIIFLPGLAFAGVTIKLSGVPDELCFPLPAGTNAVLTATVQGGEVKAVWLSPKKDSQVRLMLAPVGDHTYQVNLADPVLSAMICAEGTPGQFQIFAETEDGGVVASIPVHYVVAKPLRLPPRIYIYVDGKKKEILTPSLVRRLEDMGVRIHLSDSSLWVLPTTYPPGKFGRVKATDTYFFPPGEVHKIQIRFQEDALKPFARARVADKTWVFRASKQKNVLDLQITAKIRKAWKEHGNMELVCSQGGTEAMRLILTARPKRLNFTGDSVKMTIIQRQLKEVPGSDGYLSVYIDDITGGQVLLTIITAAGQNLVDQTSVRRGDSVTFTIGEEKYRLTVKTLVNFLAGDDYGVFTIHRLPPPELDESAEHKKIERLIDIIQKSKIIFIRNNKEYTPSEAAEHIREKYEYARKDIHTLEEFIDKVASHSWISDQDYLVKLPDGTQVKAKKWLQEQATELDRPEAKNQ